MNGDPGLMLANDLSRSTKVELATQWIASNEKNLSGRLRHWQCR